MKPRYYQNEAVGKAMQFIDEGEGNPLIVLPTGSGKSLVIKMIVDEFLSENPDAGIMILSHTMEILKQDYAILEQAYGDCVGVFSAGLGRKEVSPITVAGIQSVYSHVHKFIGYVGLVIIDEAHLVPFDGDGRYRTFMMRMRCPFLGVTATPFRLKGGYLHEGKGAVFTKIVYDLGSGKGYNKLEEQGYISKLICKATDIFMDTEGVKRTGGDFNKAALAEKFDRETMTKAIVDEIIKIGSKNYKHWLIFAIDIAHAEHIHKTLTTNGVKTICIHSKMEPGREKAINDIRAGKYRAVVNVDVLTTGFDFPEIDLIAMMRPTQSPVTYVQSVGRGLRVSEEKDHCLVLDFAGNIARLGPVNNVHVKTPGERRRNVDLSLVQKLCPECGVYSAPAVAVCPACLYEWPRKHGLQNARKEKIVEPDPPVDCKVKSVSYSIHQKAGKPDSLRVKYKIGLTSVTEWIGVGRSGRGGNMAKHWLRLRCPGCPEEKLPTDAHQALAWSDDFEMPEKVKVDFSGKYANVVGYSFNPNVLAIIEKEHGPDLPDDFDDDIPF